LLEYPQYTRPPIFGEMAVPDVLTSGHHEAVRKWRLKESLRRTGRRRPEFLADRQMSKEEAKLLAELRDEASVEAQSDAPSDAPTTVDAPSPE
jgi:tRNA (guanine37-N1)-methyltransferase